MPYETNEIVVSGEVEDPKSTVTGLNSYPLTVGDNEISIKVIAEDGSSSTYNILITRKEQESEKQKDIPSDSINHDDMKEEEKNSDKQESWFSNSPLYAIPILLFLLFILCFFLFKKRYHQHKEK